jgi:hypothetical protein
MATTRRREAKQAVIATALGTLSDAAMIDLKEVIRVDPETAKEVQLALTVATIANNLDQVPTPAKRRAREVGNGR